MRWLFAYLFFACVCRLGAQQTIMYTQYTFNKAGMNPAASGTDINQKYYYAFGLNRQWLDIENAPRTNFFNFSYTIRPPRSYRYWQNAGLYFDNDQGGLIGNMGLYGSYTIHYLVRKKTVLSFGVFAGARKYSRSLGFFDPSDPAVAKTKSSVIIYPDIIPGVRVSNKKFFMGLSLRQITITKIQNFKGKGIGSPSLLSPNIYFDYGRKIPLSELVLMMPSFALNMPILGPPIVDGSLLFYFGNRVGGGLSVRNMSFASAIFQIRFLQNMTAGFAYSYPVNLTRYVAHNSFEIMVGVTPMGMEDKLTGKHSVAKCPSLSY